MKTIILTIVAMGLAIPTFGMSLVIWLYLKHIYDNKAVNLILIQAKRSSNNGRQAEHLFGVNNASIRRVYSYFRDHSKPVKESPNEYWGIIIHPEIGPIELELKNGSHNTLVIKASKCPPGVTEGRLFLYRQLEQL
jgi:hypothetical protein